MRIYDAKGSEQDWGWVVEKYNLPEIDRALKDKDHWEVVELRENNRDSSMTVRARWADGSPVEGIGVKFSWPDDFVAQKTDKNGQTGFGMGGGAYYRPPKIGPHTVEILGVSDVVTGLGMLGKRDHWHLEPTFQFVRGEESSDKCQECIRKDKALSEIHAKAAEALG